MDISQFSNNYFSKDKEPTSSTHPLVVIEGKNTALPVSTTIEYPEMLHNFVYQIGDKGAKLISELSYYIEQCSYNDRGLTKSDCEEVVQETMIKILKNHHKIKTNPRSWVFKVAYHEGMNKLNAVKKTNKMLCISTLTGMIGRNANNQSIEYSSSKKESENFIVKNNHINDLDCIEYVVKKVTETRSKERDREILALFAAGYENKEIAAHTGRPRNAINKKLSTLKKNLRQFITDYC